MSYDRDRAMREQEATEAMIRMRDPDKAIKPKRDLNREASNAHFDNLISRFKK